MFVLRTKFKSTAYRLNVLDATTKKLNAQRLRALGNEFLPKQMTRALEQRQDLDDIITLWEILAIDAIICLENDRGEEVRLGVSLFDNERKAQNFLSDLKGKQRSLLRQALGLKQYWLFVVKVKNYPTDEEWIDILYDEIDQGVGASGCRLIML